MNRLDGFQAVQAELFSGSEAGAAALPVLCDAAAPDPASRQKASAAQANLLRVRAIAAADLVASAERRAQKLIGVARVLAGLRFWLTKRWTRAREARETGATA